MQKEVAHDFRYDRRMVTANAQNCSKPRANEIGRYNFERVDSFMYLGLLVNGDSIVS